jgi:hypothetical protein
MFEWGSGISTIWFARRVQELISIEHDKEWFDIGRFRLKEWDISNVDLIYSPPIDEIEISSDNETELYAGFNNFPKRFQYYQYVRTIDSFPDNHFNCISIDGRERVECLIHAVPKLSDVGFIILDDSHRSRYLDIFHILSDWKIEKFDFGLLQTTIFYRK